MSDGLGRAFSRLMAGDGAEPAPPTFDPASLAPGQKVYVISLGMGGNGNQAFASIRPLYFLQLCPGDGAHQHGPIGPAALLTVRPLEGMPAHFPLVEITPDLDKAKAALTTASAALCAKIREDGRTYAEAVANMAKDVEYVVAEAVMRADVGPAAMVPDSRPIYDAHRKTPPSFPTR